jgi:CLIP-associating protein 1/2
MEALIQGLESSDTKSRLLSAEQLYNKLKQKSSIDNLQLDLKNRVVTSCLSLVEDNNPKLCLLGLDCIQTLIECQTESYQTYMNMTFDLLMMKFGDGKPQVRSRSAEVMVSVINVIGLTTGFEKLSSYFTHKSHFLREEILHTILKLQELYGDDIMVCVHDI